MAKKRCVTSVELEEIKKKEKELANLVKGGAATKANLAKMTETTTEVNTKINNVKVEAKKRYVEYTLTGILPIALPSKSYKRINSPEIWDEKKKKWTSPWLGPTFLFSKQSTIVGNDAVYLQKYGSYRRAILNGLATLESNGIETPNDDTDWPYLVETEGNRIRVRWTILIEDTDPKKSLQEELQKLIDSKENPKQFNSLAKEIIDTFLEFVPEVEATAQKLREEYGIQEPPPTPQVANNNAFSELGTNTNIGGLTDALNALDAINTFAKDPASAISNIAAGALSEFTSGINLTDPASLIPNLQAQDPLAFTSTTPISQLDLCEVFPEDTEVTTRGGKKEVEAKPPQVKEPTSEQSNTTSIETEETIVKPKEQPIETIKPEAAVVDPVSKEVKPITRSLDKIEEDIIASNKLIVSKFVDSLTGPFGNISLELPKQYPNFEARNYLESKKMRKFYKDEFRSKEQYKVMKSTLKEYRNTDEGIKRGISILDTQKVREYGFDAGLSQDDLDFYERFISANLEQEQIDNEIQFYYSVIGHYITVLADSSSRGVIAVFGDIKMPENKILDTGYELQTPTKYIGTPTDPRLGNNGAELVDDWSWRTTPEGRSENYMKNYFEFKKTRAWIYTDTYGPSATIPTMSSIRAANFFGILIPEAMLIAQQHHDLYLEYKAATDNQRFDILPSTRDWYDIANS